MSFTDKGLDIANQHIYYAEYILLQRPNLLVQKSLHEIADVAYSHDNRLSDPSFWRDGPRGQRIVAGRRQRDVEDSVPEVSAADSLPLFASCGTSLWARLTSSHGGKPNVLNLCALYDSMHFFHDPLQAGDWEPQPPNCSRFFRHGSPTPVLG